MNSYTKEKILEAASRCFSKTGYARTTMDKIAEESRVSKGTLYWYFKSKEDLFVELKERQVERAIKELEEIFSKEEAFYKRLMDAISMFFSSLTPDKRELARLNAVFLAEAPRIPKLNSMLKLQHRKVKELIETAVEEAISRGEIRGNVTPEMLSTVLLALIDGLEIHWAILEIDLDWEKLKKFLLKLLRFGLEPK